MISWIVVRESLYRNSERKESWACKVLAVHDNLCSALNNTFTTSPVRLREHRERNVKSWKAGRKAAKCHRKHDNHKLTTAYGYLACIYTRTDLSIIGHRRTYLLSLAN